MSFDHRFKFRPIHAALLAALAALPAGADERPPETTGEAKTLDTVKVEASALGAVTEGTGSYTTGSTNTATKFGLSPRETPQSVSVITRTQMDDFGVTDINDALESTTGVTVEKVETDRTYYTARGFDITNFQVDGVGVPFVYGNVYGNLDTAFYDRIEVLRGGSGLTAGVSDPSATINFVRKPPTRELQTSVGTTVGSWNNRRVEADVSGALTEAGGVRARAVAAYQDKESFLDRYAHEKTVFYGVLEADIAERTLLTFGHSRQNNRADSPLWGALPLYNTDGEPTDYDVSTSTSADWAYWKTEFASTFAELAREFANGWQAKAVLTRNKATNDSKLFYVYGTPDPTTPGSDLYSYPSRYDAVNEQTILDVYASGPFALLGREHELVVGANRSKSTMKDISYYGEDIGTEIPPLETWDGSYPEPAFSGGTDGGDTVDTQTGLYAAARFSVTDELKVIGGARATDLDSKGETYGRSREKSYGTVVTPYAGAVYDLSDLYSVYASYTELFRPQFEVDINGDRLDPVTGKSYEAGLKRESRDKKLNTTFAVFQTKQRNLAELAGTVPFWHYTTSGQIESVGYEFDVAGELAPGWQFAAGLTYVKIEDDGGDYAKTYIPKNLLRVSTTYRVRAMQGLKVGARLKWQDDIYVESGTATTGPNAGSPIKVEQDSYALIDLMARYDITKQWSATLNLNNVTDEKYYSSLYWGSYGQAPFGAPRNVSLTVSWKH
jgi:outer membrane receptor for ferric coprogen and ferric-rhodotorulic acid